MNIFPKFLWKRYWWARVAIDHSGITFPYQGDEIIWIWPWKRMGGEKYISVLFSGTGQFGDCKFTSLQDIKEAWNKSSK